jgi:hypothetical protein
MNEQKVFIHQKCIDIMLKIISNRNPHLMERVKERWLRCKNKYISNTEIFDKMNDEMQKEIIRKLTADTFREMTE